MSKLCNKILVGTSCKTPQKCSCYGVYMALCFAFMVYYMTSTFMSRCMGVSPTYVGGVMSYQSVYTECICGVLGPQRCPTVRAHFSIAFVAYQVIHINVPYNCTPFVHYSCVFFKKYIWREKWLQWL